MENRNSDQMHKTLIIIWGAMIFSQLMFLAVVFFTKPEFLSFNFSKPLLGENAIVTAALAAAAFMSVVLSFVLAPHFKNQGISQQKPELIQTALVIGCAFCEACSLIGIVLAFAFNYQYFFLFIGLGVLATIFHFPKKSDLDAAAFKKM